MRFALFTKTRWDEPPRLRHQLARLLHDHGHEVVFVEKPTTFGRVSRRTANGIELWRFGELLHHQLRAGRRLAALNAWFETRQWGELRRALDRAIILNFNYDYWFLRREFPHHPIVTIINDDFVARARPISREEAGRSFRQVVQEADAVLAVSDPLCGMIKAHGGNVERFLPWARLPYRRPPEGAVPTATLYWGYLNHRLDWPLIGQILSAGVRIHFAGPIADGFRWQKYLRHPAAMYHGVASLEALEPVMAECGSSLLPYDLTRSDLAVTMSNRGFDLLSRGLALLYAPYPQLLSAPPGVIHVCRSAEEFVRSHEAACRDFWTLQPSIARFLEGHTEERRYHQFMATVQHAMALRGLPEARADPDGPPNAAMGR